MQRFVLCQRIPNRLRHLFLIAVAEQPLFIRRLPQKFGDVHLPHQRTGQLVQRRTADEHGNQPNCRADDQPHRAGRNQRDPAAAAEVRRHHRDDNIQQHLHQRHFRHRQIVPHRQSARCHHGLPNLQALHIHAILLAKAVEVTLHVHQNVVQPRRDHF